MATLSFGQIPVPKNLRVLTSEAAGTATNLWFFAATATDKQGLESDFSSEVVLTNIFSNSPISLVTLAWDKSSGTNVITNYTIYFGSAHTNYTNLTLVGTNLTGTVRVLPAPLTNTVLTVTTTGTNLYRSSTLNGPWISLGRTSYAVTNSPSPFYFRSRPSSSKVSIKTVLQ